MGLLGRWDERNQRTAEWQNELGRRHPNPDLRIGRTVGSSLAGMAVLSALGALVTPVIGDNGWLALLAVVCIGCFASVYVIQKRKRRQWETTRRQ